MCGRRPAADPGGRGRSPLYILSLIVLVIVIVFVIVLVFVLAIFANQKIAFAIFACFPKKIYAVLTSMSHFCDILCILYIVELSWRHI